MMTAIMKKHLGKNKKGFTLIEVVVVLVILAILAAIAVPALTGYIDDAKERSTITESRTILVALQHMASTDVTDNGGAHGDATSYFAATTLRNKGTTKLLALTGIDSNALGTISRITLSGDTVESFRYVKDGITIDYKDQKFVKI